uniref:Phosphoinositide phospholipase C n=1 Tax=Eptatretus burgeri TaxID=7764 RepID=A0A8C4QWH7_EPTBU
MCLVPKGREYPFRRSSISSTLCCTCLHNHGSSHVTTVGELCHRSLHLLVGHRLWILPTGANWTRGLQDSTRQKHERKKTVSFSSMPAEKKISSAVDCVNLMQEGCELKKVRSNSRVYLRYFLLDSDLRSVRWEPSKKDSEKARIEIATIKEVRAGKNTDIFRSNGIAEQISEDCAFSVIYGEAYESLDLVANTADVANAWITGLRFLLSYGQPDPSSMAAIGHGDILRMAWLNSEFDAFTSAAGSTCLSEEMACVLIHHLHLGLRDAHVNLKVKEVLKNRERLGCTLDKEDFAEVYRELATRPEIYFLLVQFSRNKEYLDAKDLVLFLEAEQGMAAVSEETCLDLIRRYEPSAEGRENGLLGLDGFTRYLLSAECDIFDPEHGRVCHDMDQPLSHYFILSSHNSFLVEDQVHGPADIGGILRALRLGCRSIELVVWDSDGQLVVTNRPTATSSIPLQDVLQVVAENAFVASDYPLILSLEVHCPPSQQCHLACILKQVLREKLFLERPVNDTGHLPSPAALRGRILLKAQALPWGYPDSEGEISEEEEASERLMSYMPVETTPSSPVSGCRGRIRIRRELSELVTLCRSVPFTNFETALRMQHYWEVCSIGELQALRLATERHDDFLRYNKRCLSRVYPSPQRTDSSNLSPMDFWKCGCQLISLNVQTPGLMLDLGLGWFRQNGGCGYVLRPSVMREEVAYFRADTREMCPGLAPQILHLKVLSGQNLPKPKGSGTKGDVLDPYIAVEIHGIPADCADRRTKTVHHDGDRPIFDESFEFHLNLPELALLRLVVLDDDFIGDEFIGQHTIPVECLQPGYRHIPLLAITGEPLLHASLFVHIAVTNRRGGGKPHKRGLSVRKGRRSHDYVALRIVGIKTVDELFRTATQPLREATDLRENALNAVLSLIEVCGLSPVAKLTQCMHALSSRLLNAEGAPPVTLTLHGQRPCLEPQGPVPEVVRKALAAYDLMVQESQTLLEMADSVHSKLIQCQKAGLEQHAELCALGAKEGLKGRKLSKAVENFTWNITLLKGQADLLRQAKAESQENLRQVHCAALSCGLGRRPDDACPSSPLPISPIAGRNLMDAWHNVSSPVEVGKPTVGLEDGRVQRAGETGAS